MSQKKRIFLIWSGSQKSAAKAISFFKQHGYETVYWIGTDEDGIRMPGVVFHDRLPSRKGIPAEGHSALDYPPPAASLVRELYKTESLVLTMMNRKVDTETHTFTLDEKKRLYYWLVRYWSGIVEQYSPDAIVSSNFPHNISTTVLSAVAKRKEIPFLFLHETWVSDRIIPQRDYEEGSPGLLEAIRQHAENEVSLEDLAPDMQEFLKKHIESGKDATPLDVVLLKKRFSGARLFLIRLSVLWKGILVLSLFRKVWRFVKRTVGDNLEKEYRRIVQPADLSKPYVYVALHWQPEGSTSPLGDMFVDQILMIETLAYALPKGWTLYVKEHPFQWMIGGNISFMPMRYRGYYEAIAKIPNVTLVPIETDTFLLEEKAKAVATVTGRAALEGILRGKPALIFGYPWFMDMPGLFRISDADTAKKAFTSIEGGFRPNWQSVLQYFNALDNISVRGYIDELARGNSPLSREESEKNIRTLFLQELHRIFGSV